MKQILESMYSDTCFVIPMADVQHVEKIYQTCNLADGTEKGDLAGIMIITKHTHWNLEADVWDNNIWLPTKSALKFMEAWYYYRHTLDQF